MKIALVTKRVSRSLGGAERVSAHLAEKLSGSGNEVHILTGHVDTELQHARVRLIRAFRWISPLRLLSFNRKVREITRNEKFDLVYSLCQVYPVDIYRVGDGIHRHWMKVQYPNSIRRWTKYATSLVHLAMRYLEGRIFDEGNHKFIITNSELVKNQIITYFGLNEDKIRVIYNGVDSDIFNPGVKVFREKMRRQHCIAESDTIILFVSNNWERKGLTTIIDAISKTGDRNIRLIVAGRGKPEKYISFAASRGIAEERIIFTGRTESVEKYYGMADIFILPSMYEPFANVCLEAMACGLPVVTTTTNGSSEVITDGIDGFVLENWADSDRLRDIIIMMNDNALCRQIGENGAKTASGYTWEKHLAETLRVFEILTGNRF